MLVHSHVDAKAPAAQRLQRILDTPIPSDKDELVQAFLFLSSQVEYQLQAPLLLKMYTWGCVPALRWSLGRSVRLGRRTPRWRLWRLYGGPTPLLVPITHPLRPCRRASWPRCTARRMLRSRSVTAIGRCWPSALRRWSSWLGFRSSSCAADRLIPRLDRVSVERCGDEGSGGPRRSTTGPSSSLRDQWRQLPRCSWSSGS
jgi:hypothetical protein